MLGRDARARRSPRSSPSTAAPGSPWASAATSGRAIFRQVETFSQVEINKFGTPSLITRNTNDVQQVQMVVFMGLTVMVSAPIMIIGGDDHGLPRGRARCRPCCSSSCRSWSSSSGWSWSGRSRCSGRCRSSSTASTRSCARRSPASGSSARSSATEHEEERFDDGQPGTCSRPRLRVNRLFALTIPVMTADLQPVDASRSCGSGPSASTAARCRSAA